MQLDTTSRPLKDEQLLRQGGSCFWELGKVSFSLLPSASLPPSFAVDLGRLVERVLFSWGGLGHLAMGEESRVPSWGPLSGCTCLLGDYAPLSPPQCSWARSEGGKDGLA